MSWFREFYEMFTALLWSAIWIAILAVVFSLTLGGMFSLLSIQMNSDNVTQNVSQTTLAPVVYNYTMIYNYTSVINNTEIVYVDNQREESIQPYLEPSEQCDGKRLSQMKTEDYFGLSNLPLMRPGDLMLTVKPDFSKRFVAGEWVIIRQNATENVAHPIYAIYPDYFTAKGVNNKDIDVITKSVNETHNVLIPVHYTYDQIKSVFCGILRKGVVK